MKKVLVTGAGGFIGHHLVKYLVDRGYWVRGVDIKAPEFEQSAAHEFELLDLRFRPNCNKAVKDVEEVYHLAADMGGIGYITSNHSTVASNNTMINVHILDASLRHNVSRLIFSSTACIYPTTMQEDANIAPLKEDDAYPAFPEEGYGWEKLYMEKLCEYYNNDTRLDTRIVRFHNVFGPLGTYQGGREKSPAALCRKVSLAKDTDSVEVWGDGEQTRSFMYIDDCVEGIYRIMRSDYSKPLNLGRDEMVSINQLLKTIADVAGKNITANHDLSKPQGVRGRNSDNSRIREVLNWEPQIDLEQGLAKTYEWIHAQVTGTAEETLEYDAIEDAEAA